MKVCLSTTSPSPVHPSVACPLAAPHGKFFLQMLAHTFQPQSQQLHGSLRNLRPSRCLQTMHKVSYLLSCGSLISSPINASMSTCTAEAASDRRGCDTGIGSFRAGAHRRAAAGQALQAPLFVPYTTRPGAGEAISCLSSKLCNASRLCIAFPVAMQERLRLCEECLLSIAACRSMN